MNCPRCTHESPDEARYCPACGLDLSQVEGGGETEQVPDPAKLADGIFADEIEDAETPTQVEYWPHRFRVHPTAGGKRPFLAVTLAFFFGPFAYLYLEQSSWFWWGLAGGLLLLIMTRFDLLPLLVIGFMLHAYDVATTLNENDRLRGYEV